MDHEVDSARWSPGRRRWRLAAALAALGLGAAASSPEVGDGARLWLDVHDERGRAVPSLDAADLAVVEAGEEVPVVAVEPGVAPSRLVLYFDRQLGGRAALRLGAEALTGLARQLTALGEVEVVVADPEPASVLRTRDPLALEERLRWLTARSPGEEPVVELRRDTLQELAVTVPPLPVEEQARRVVDAARQELAAARRGQRRLLAWAAELRGAAPRVLFLVDGGFDLDPITFYSQHLDAAAVHAVAAESAGAPELETAVEETARSLAAGGWTVLPVAVPASAGAPFTLGTETSEGRNGEAVTTAGVTLRPGALLRRRRPATEEEGKLPDTDFVAPLAPLQLLAEATGGEVLTSAAAVGQAVAGLAGRHLLTYASHLPVDSGLRPIEVRPKRAGLTVRAPRWVSRGTPEAVSGARLERLLAGEEAEGAFDVAAVLTLPASGAGRGELEARADLRSLDAPHGATAATLRVTVAVSQPGAAPRLVHQLLPDEELAGRDEWLFHTSLDLPPDADRVAVVIEELESGRWGGGIAAVVGEGEGLLPSRSVVEIQRPDEELLRGRVRIEAAVYEAAVARVAFFLDDQRVDEASRAPFVARLDLGRTPRRRTLAAVAYDAAGAELGRDTVILNGGSGLAVQIVRPTVLRGVGPVEVEAEVAVPAERRLDRVLFYWNNELAATLFGPPYRHAVTIPRGRPVGYIRVVARLDDGSQVEDVAFMNGPTGGERVDVDLVELYVVVTDRDGRPVRDLEEGDFRLTEGGQPRQIATFSAAGELPVTLGMAIDSSASMFVKLPRVQEAAARFLRSTFAAGDQLFVVDFDSQPRLARGVTGDLDAALAAIGRLEAGGRTALWESLVYSLVQLQGVPGRKALVVFSDGADEDDHFPFRSCLEVAKRMRVPIYLILMRHAPKSGGWSLFSRSFGSRVERLAAATGGRVFYAKEYDSLDQVYAEIGSELRSQYLLAYYAQDGAARDGWRDVDVQVARDGLTPRTLGGYWR